MDYVDLKHRLWLDYKQFKDGLEREEKGFQENFQILVENKGHLSEDERAWLAVEIGHIDYYSAMVNYIGVLLQRCGESESNNIPDELLDKKIRFI